LPAPPAPSRTWLAARAEGLGLGWVSIFDPQELARLLQMPEGAHPLGVLCLGPVDAYYAEPMLQQEKWACRAPLEDMLMDDLWDARATAGGGHAATPSGAAPSDAAPSVIAPKAAPDGVQP
jgi:5,6-dimethylbenzimidazole synthase